jgi:pilus assembly protein CpaE
VQTLRDLGMPRDRLRLVLNRADSKVGLTIREVEKSLGTEIDATLPSSREVPFAINQGVPVVLSRPKAPVAKALVELLETVRPKTAGQSDGHAWTSRRRR